VEDASFAKPSCHIVITKQKFQQTLHRP